VYSDADAQSLHVALADEALRIGGPAARDSYLAGERIVEAARCSGASAIHPGYGFLSENAPFAESCERAGIAFIGPPPEAIRVMGDKSAAKSIMERAGVPVVPGFHGSDQDPDTLLRQAGQIGFPVLIKASAGGGGKGMRVVERANEFGAALAACRREAASAFADERVLLEKYLDHPRHIEIQVFADGSGGCIHVFERDCSVQRRHQKVIEEAPAPGMSDALRREMGEAAIAAARAVGYVGAGTIEFLVDRGGRFYFMEMNTRLQVEHPVTEMITGIDLVEWQIRVAAGEKLPLAQGDLHIDGHAIEARVYAEDPIRDFLPSPGRIAHLALPAESRHVRVDTGVRAGDAISAYYDPLIAKLVVWDRDRERAIGRLRSALAEFEIAGPASNLGLLFRVAHNRDFVAGDLDTGLIERHREELLAPAPPAGDDALALAALAALAPDGTSGGPWNLADAWRLNRDSHREMLFREAEREFAVTARRRATGFELELNGRRLATPAPAGRALRIGTRFEVFLPGTRHSLRLHDPLSREIEPEAHAGDFAAPMPGRITAILVTEGAQVEKGATLMILEAMKMEHSIKAPAKGRVGRIHYRVGEQVTEGTDLIDFEEET
jgi:3-methylcrotonyl-CoA carboxylase alpha subunit